MTSEDIDRMAREAGFSKDVSGLYFSCGGSAADSDLTPALERFAALVREACAKMVENYTGDALVSGNVRVIDWGISNRHLLAIVQGLREAADPNGNCDLGDLWGYCEEAADVIENIMQREEKVRAAEREACAQIAQEWDEAHLDTNYGRCIAVLIRGREMRDLP